MKKLILIGGVLAGGKSKFSHLLGERFTVPVVNKDRLKEILGDSIFTSNREENKKLSVISFALMMYLAHTEGESLILESNFKDYEMSELRSSLGDTEVLSIFFDGDNEVLHQRFIKRLSEDRHPVHKSQDFTAIEDFISTLDELRSVDYPGEVLRVDCTDFSYQDDEKLYETVKVFLNK